MGLKVLHVIPSVGPLRGGPSVVVRTLARSLAAQGIEVHVATTDDNGPEKLAVPFNRTVDEDGATFWYFRRQTRFYIFSWPFTSWLWRRVRDFDLVHIHALFSYPATAAAWIAWFRRVPYLIRPLGVLNEWGMANRRPRLKSLSFRLIEKRILARAAAVHFTSAQERREASRVADVRNCVVIHNPAQESQGLRESVRGSLLARYPSLLGRKIVLFLSRIDAKKGLDLLLPAFARVRAGKPATALVVAGGGDGSLIARLKREAAELGIENDVIWTGFVEGAEKAAALADADVFVLPSYSENFGVAVLDAMAFHVPVIISDQVGLQEKIAATAAGIVVPCRVPELAGAIEKLLSDPALAESCACNADRLWSQEFAPDAVARSLLRVYEEIQRSACSERAAALPRVSK